MPTPCFLLAPTDIACRTLRRFAFAARGVCPADPSGMSGHHAHTDLDPGAFVRDARGYIPMFDWPDDDPQWPERCVCGYAFAANDPRSRDQEPIFLTPDGVFVHTHAGRRNIGNVIPASPGAMWEAPWFADIWHGADGKCYVLRLPDGTDWIIDGPATSGGTWTRTGAPPILTARPSIKSPHYHGWLTDGVLSDHIG